MLSACLLLTLSNQLPPQENIQIAPVLKPIKINLMSLMAPKPEPAPAIMSKAPEQKVQPIPPKQYQPTIQTKQRASNVINSSAKKVAAKKTPRDIKDVPKAPAPKPISERKLAKIEPKKKIEKLIERPKPSVEKKLQTTVATQPTEKETASKDNRGKSTATIIQNATYRRQSPPSYPRRALDLGQQGTVMIHARVSLIGHPEDLKVAKSSGHKLLDLSALSAVKKWEFEPVNINGKPTVGWVRVPVNFVIQ